MCIGGSGRGGGSQVVVPQQQLNQGGALLSNEKVVATTAEKTGNKRKVNSLRIPLNKSKTTDTSTVGVNTDDTSVGLNIPT